MHLVSEGLSLQGRRSNNEDAWLEAPELGLYVVADGLGGYEGGEVASRLVTSELREFVQYADRDPQGTWPVKSRPSRTFEENLLFAAGVAAHREVLARKTGRLAQMGSTVVSALIRRGVMTVMHCGDSRLYRSRHGRTELLTRDHSLWAEMQAAGLASERSAFAYKNQITRALGLDGHAECDVASFDVQPGDVVLLCSDGLYDPFDETRLEPLLHGDVDTLVQRAFDLGSSDNITGLLVRVRR